MNHEIKVGVNRDFNWNFIACPSSNQPMDITYPQPSINIPAEGQKPPIDSEVEIKTPVLKSDQIEEPINQTDENEERVDCLVSATVIKAVDLLQLQMSEKQHARYYS